MFKYQHFIDGELREHPGSFTYVSLFSGAGVGDYGLKLAGGKCLAACEIDKHRAAVHKHNVNAPIWGNLRVDKDRLIASLNGRVPDLLIATPPCQGFSTANARRGLREDPRHAGRDERNNLFFEALHVIRAVKPRIVLFENVPNFLKRKIRSRDGKVIGRVEEFIQASLLDYEGVTTVTCFSALGVPQRRVRSLAIFIRKDIHEDWADALLDIDAWPARPVDVPSTILEALEGLPALDGRDDKKAVCSSDPLHQVPSYSERHYRWVADIPAASGKSAWENSCQVCGFSDTPIFEVVCARCNSNMYNRPHVVINATTIRAIKGFRTSYKRMAASELAPTITTASSHFSSDIKIHPTQNRVLSARECALLQTIPWTFDWPEEQLFKKGYLVREMIGEAIPPLVTYRFGRALSDIKSLAEHPTAA